MTGSSGGRQLNRQLRLRLSADLEARLADYARGRDLSISTAARDCLRRGLIQEKSEPGQAETAALAGLVAAEHVLLLVETIVPGGRNRAIALGAEAARAAQLRLLEVRDLEVEG